jgi:hypothetical protein
MLKEFKEEIIMIGATIFALLITIYVLNLQATDPSTFRKLGVFLVDLLYRTLYILFQFIISLGGS